MTARSWEAALARLEDLYRRHDPDQIRADLALVRREVEAAARLRGVLGDRERLGRLLGESCPYYDRRAGFDDPLDAMKWRNMADDFIVALRAVLDWEGA